MSLPVIAAILLGGLLLYLLFQITTLAYRIDRRSHPERYAPGVEPGRLNVLAVAINWKIARDPDTQSMRRRMNLMLLAVMIGFIGIGLLVSHEANRAAAGTPASTSRRH